MLLVLEGVLDYQFLKRLVRRLRLEDPSLLDLARLVAQGRLVVMPLGGGDAAQWPTRFATLGLGEFHLYDREQAPETARRQRAIEQLQQRPDCRGVVLAKRALENYLHPAAIAAAGGSWLEINDHDSVPGLLAAQRLTAAGLTTPWPEVAYRTRRRALQLAKRWLNHVAVEHMSAGLLAQRDPQREVHSWLDGVRALLEMH